jgi:hypothetical protein
MTARIIGFPSRVPDKAARIRGLWPKEWSAGARAGYEAKSYPHGFCAWPLDRRNAWFSGFNRGRCDRLRHASEKEA